MLHIFSSQKNLRTIKKYKKHQNPPTTNQILENQLKIPNFRRCLSRRCFLNQIDDLKKYMSETTDDSNTNSDSCSSVSCVIRWSILMLCPNRPGPQMPDSFSRFQTAQIIPLDNYETIPESIAILTICRPILKEFTRFWVAIPDVSLCWQIPVYAVQISAVDILSVLKNLKVFLFGKVSRKKLYN